MSRIWDIKILNPLVFHPRARNEIRALPKPIRFALGRTLNALRTGQTIGMPMSRPMPAVAMGVEELREESWCFGPSRKNRSRHHYEKSTSRNSASRNSLVKRKPTTTRNARELADTLGLSPEDAMAIELRVSLNQKIIATIRKFGLTHAAAASIVGTSRSRLTAIANGNIDDVSTDLMLRILARLGVRATVKFSRAA
jgi:predicted XRE-type DNA-binding protein